ncbi:hypothetical protein [Laspinema olomoucense]|uniref:Uncharacterized protein n=1 Tax=Laspinema olomoucense D3b TaxID=2953688 RepID=A0ABT2N0R8_9CYAN|nr:MULTISPECIES: hypothetical protein [unclassified Laspinema]MCT7970913.1 hypothetical protein [Laspinema sp. D3d]MCT7976267.1 hypothetical protein [Laspinema sp. D3b]MCT7991016.1 hypothetical protein [Laspinema sp. D3a]MCT7997398.1 hypothetical protein [Laspinema sp. D3c]
MGVSGSWEWILYRLYLPSDDLAAILGKPEGRSPPVFSKGLNPVVALFVRFIWTRD